MALMASTTAPPVGTTKRVEHAEPANAREKGNRHAPDQITARAARGAFRAAAAGTTTSASDQQRTG